VITVFSGLLYVQRAVAMYRGEQPAAPPAPVPPPHAGATAAR